MNIAKPAIQHAGKALPQSEPSLSNRRATTTRPVRLHIDRLVLHGFAAADRNQIADQIQSELQRLIRGSHAIRAAKNSIALEGTAAETFNHRFNAHPQATANQIAYAIFQNLQRSVASPGDSPHAPLKASGLPKTSGRSER